MMNIVRKAVALAVLGAFLTGCSSPEERIEQHYQSGMQLLQAGEVAKAGLEFRNALTIDNDTVPSLFALADVEQRLGNIQKAAGFYRRVSDLDPQHVGSRVKLGELLLSAGALDEGARVAREALVLDDSRSDVLMLNGAAAFQLRSFDEAVGLANTVLKQNPTSADALMMLAAVRLESGDPQGALAYINQAEADNENNQGLILFKIRVLEQLGHRAEIEGNLVRLVELNPHQLAIRLALVRWYASLNDIDKAEAAFRQAVTDNPGSDEAGVGLAAFLLATRGEKAARIELQRRVDGDDASARYRMALARLDFGAGRRDQARSLLQEFIDSATAEQAPKLDAQAELARMFAAWGDNVRAEELVAKVLELDSQHVAALVVRATMRLKQDETEAGITDLRSALQQAPQSPEVNLMLAEAYERGGHLELAEERLAAVAANSSYEPGAVRPYLQFLWRIQKMARIDDVLARVLERSPSDVETLKQVADIRLRRGDWAGAEAAAEAIGKVEVDDSLVADQIVAAALQGQQQYDASLTLLKDLHKRRAGGSLTALVQAYIAAGQAQEAEQLLRTTIAQEPGNAEVHALLGTVLAARGDREAAKIEFTRAVELAPSSEANYRVLARLHVDAGDAVEAEDVLKEGLSRLPDSAALRIAHAGLMEQNGDWTGAIREYEKALASEPLSVVAANNLASLLADYTSDPESLQRAYLLSRRLRNLDIGFFQDTVGWVHYRRGEYEAAQRILFKAAEALPGMPLVQYHLGKTYLALGDKVRATEALNKALELAGSSSFAQRELVQAALQEIAAGADNRTLSESVANDG